MISETERKLIEEAQQVTDIDAAVRIAQQAKNPFFLCEYAGAYNWDDGVDIANAVADNPHCDLGTALSLFWLADAMCYLTGETPRNEYNIDWANLCDKLIERIPRGLYKLGPVSFDPGQGKVQIYKYSKLGVPPIFYTPVTGLPNVRP